MPRMKMEKEFNSKDKSMKFKKAWSWPQRVEDYIKDLIKNKYSCHVFCGNSELGNIRVDLETDKATHKEDVLEGLSFKDDTFDVVFGDPPWKMPYHVRSKVLYEMRRITKRNGLIILNCNWYPNNLKGCLLLEPFFISANKMPFSNVAFIFRYIKLMSEKELQDKLSGDL